MDTVEIIHEMEGEIQIGDTFRKPKFRKGNRLQTFDRVVANPMWNQTEFKGKDYDADELDRFPKGAGFPGSKADWGWMQHILASLKSGGRAAVLLDTGAASHGSGNANTNKEKEKYSRIVTHEEIAKNNFNISPSRYIHTGKGEEYRPIAEIVEGLNSIEEEARETDAALKGILKKIGT